MNGDICVNIKMVTRWNPELIWAEQRLECPAGMGGMSQELHASGGSQARRDVNLAVKCDEWLPEPL